MGGRSLVPFLLWQIGERSIYVLLYSSNAGIPSSLGRGITPVASPSIVVTIGLINLSLYLLLQTARLCQCIKAIYNTTSHVSLL